MRIGLQVTPVCGGSILAPILNPALALLFVTAFIHGDVLRKPRFVGPIVTGRVWHSSIPNHEATGLPWDFVQWVFGKVVPASQVSPAIITDLTKHVWNTFPCALVFRCIRQIKDSLHGKHFVF